MTKAYFHLPGLFEFYEFYKVFLPLYAEHREYFYDWCDIGSIYGAPEDALWGGGRVGFGDNDPEDVLKLMKKYGFSSRLTFSNLLLKPEHLSDAKCNRLCKMFSDGSQLADLNNCQNGVIVGSDVLVDYLKENYPELYLVSSTTKVITDFDTFKEELENPNYSYVVPDFRLNKSMEELEALPAEMKDKVEFLVNECCWVECPERRNCYENVSRKALGEDVNDHICCSPDAKYGYVFSRAMINPAFISLDDIRDTYLEKGFSQFKIEGRSLGSALLLEFILYYMTKPECQLMVREAVYLDASLDLF